MVQLCATTTAVAQLAPLSSHVVFGIGFNINFISNLIENVHYSTRMGFEPTRAEHNGLAVHRLNHSATSSSHCKKIPYWKKKMVLFMSKFVRYGLNLLSIGFQQGRNCAFQYKLTKVIWSSGPEPRQLHESLRAESQASPKSFLT